MTMLPQGIHLNRRRIFVLVIFLKIAVSALVYYSLYSNQSVTPKTQTNAPKIPVILEYTNWFGVDMMAALERANACPDVQCEFTSDRARLHEASAVIIHPRDINIGDLPKRAHPHQKMVFITSESPFATHYMNGATLVSTPARTYDWTMGYRSDSTCRRPYGLWETADEKIVVDEPKLSADFHNKSKLAVWLVSACTSHSNRDKLVETLKHAGVSIDIWGQCGNQTACPKDRNDECNLRIESEFYFYLAFENAICRDYVTEKIFNRLHLNSIPIVLNRRIMQSSGLPDTAFIAVDDFADATSLKTHLISLTKNETAYRSYFAYRKTHRPTEYSNLGMCCLCRRLIADQSTTSIDNQSIESIHDWFVTNAKCDANPQFFKR